MIELIHSGATLLVEAILLVEALIDCGMLVYAFASAVAAIVLFFVTSQANAETSNGFVVTDQVASEDDDREQLHLRTGVAGPGDQYVVPRFVFGDNLYIEPAP